MSFFIVLLVIIVLYMLLRIYRSGKENSIRKHGLCCDECRIRDLCDKYKEKQNIS